MRTAYPAVIAETEEGLAAAERRQRGRPAAPRVRVLCLLKGGAATSLGACAAALGSSPRQVARWWKRYREAGLAGLVAEPARPGRAPRLTPEALAGLAGEMRAGRIAPLEDARRSLRDGWGVEYASLNGVRWPLRKRRIALRTGRRRHRRADAAAQAALTAGFRGGA